MACWAHRGLMLVFLFAMAGCSKLTAEQEKYVGTWVLVKPSDRGSVTRELTLHDDGRTLTTVSRSVYDEAVANAKGKGEWTLLDGIVSAEWKERQTVGEHSQEVEYEVVFRLDDQGGQPALIVPHNQDRYIKK